MKIHLTGAVWHASMADRIKRAFESLGHDVLFFNEKGDERFELWKKILSRTARRPYEVEDFFRKRASRQWEDSVRRYKPDLIVLEYAVNIVPGAVEKIRGLSKPIVYWVTSPPDLLQAKDLLWSAHSADFVFVMDRDWMPLVDHFAPKGRIYNLPLAGSPEDFYPLPGVQKIFDASFVGSFSPQYPDGLLRAFFIDQIPKHYKIGIFGHGIGYWLKYFPRLQKFASSENVVSSKKLNEIYNQSKIVLNIHSTGHRTSISARTFDAALAGAFQIVDWREDLERLFPAGIFPTFKSADEMVKLINYWIDKSEKRSEQAERVRELVEKNHTWKNRMEEILRIINS